MTATSSLMPQLFSPELVKKDEDALVAAALVVADPGVFSSDDWAAMFGVDAVDIIGDVVVDAATGSALVLGGVDLSDAELNRLIDKHVNRLKSLGPEISSTLRETLQGAMTTNLTLDEVTELLAVKGPLRDGAAATIARTELSAAANAGMHAAWAKAGVPFKRWKSMHDDRVRDAHAAADGQTVPVGMAFEIAGRQADYPGDPRLPIGLRINCRCFMERIDAGGRVVKDRLDDATVDELYQLAKQLGIPGRSKMRKQELRNEIDRWMHGFGDQRMETMTRPQLLQRARLEGVRGRHGMSKKELMDQLRQANPGVLGPDDSADRWRSDSGYVTRNELRDDQSRARRDFAFSARQGDVTDPTELGLPDAEGVETLRTDTFARFDGVRRGHVGCACCGAKLSVSDDPTVNPFGHEVMSLVRLQPDRPWERRNVAPVCRADAEHIARTGRTGFEEPTPIQKTWAPGKKSEFGSLGTGYDALGKPPVSEAAARRLLAADSEGMNRVLRGEPAGRQLVSMRGLGVDDRQAVLDDDGWTFAGHEHVKKAGDQQLAMYSKAVARYADLPDTPENRRKIRRQLKAAGERVPDLNEFYARVDMRRRLQLPPDHPEFPSPREVQKVSPDSMRYVEVERDLDAERLKARARELSDAMVPLEQGIRTTRVLHVRPDDPLYEAVMAGKYGEIVDPGFATVGTPAGRLGPIGTVEVRMEVRLPAGSKVLPIDNVTGEGRGRLVLPPGTRMRVVDYPVDEGSHIAMTVEVVPDTPAANAREGLASRPLGADVAYPQFGVRGAEIQGVAGDRALKDLLVDGAVPAGYNAKIKNTTLATHVTNSEFDAASGTIRVTAEIRQGDSPVGKMKVSTTTVSYPGYDVEVSTARIESFEVAKGRRGQGVRSEVLRDLENYWTSQSVDSVSMPVQGSSSVGVARAGWDWNVEASGMSKMGQKVARRLVSATPEVARQLVEDLAAGQSVPMSSAEVRRTLKDAGMTASQVRELAGVVARLRQDNEYAWPTPAEVVQAGHRQGVSSWPGLQAMDGLKWDAVKPLGARGAVVAGPMAIAPDRVAMLHAIDQAHWEWEQEWLPLADWDGESSNMHYLDVAGSPDAQADLAARLAAVFAAFSMVASAGQFANPWHDEQGKFAPKGSGGGGGSARELEGRFVSTRTLAAGEVVADEYGDLDGMRYAHEVTAADGQTVTVFSSAGDAATGELAAVRLTSVYDAVGHPAGRPPTGVVRPMTDVSVLSGGNADPLSADFQPTDGLVMGKTPMRITLAAEPVRDYSKPGDLDAYGVHKSTMMSDARLAELVPAARSVPYGQYLVAHEYGHSFDFSSRGALYPSSDYAMRRSRLFSRTTTQGRPVFYRDANAYEAFAEHFAEWTLSGGMTTNRDSVVWAQAFSWPSPGGSTIAP